MEDRVKSGVNLLNENGVFLSSIDDDEFDLFSNLLRFNFGKKSHLGTFVWEKKKKGTFLSGKITNVKEYIIAYSYPGFNNNLIGEIAEEETTYPCVNADNKREIVTIPKGIHSKFRESNYFLAKGSTISSGNMNMVLHSDLVIENHILKEDLTIEGNWRNSPDMMKAYAEKKEIYITQDLYLRRIVKEPRYKVTKDLLPRVGKGENQSYNIKSIDLKNLFIDGWGSNEDGNQEIMDILGTQYIFSYPKPLKLITKLLASYRNDNGIFLDYFSGSGTTGNAVITLNRLDEGNRKYILVEMGEYFNTVTKPRIQKVIYSEEWKDGKPVGKTGSSHCFKYLRLESYEDTLNNLTLKRNPTQQSLLSTAQFGEEYLLHYMLETESRDSLLDLERFKRPFGYILKVTENNELREQEVDLVETFNYLIGLVVDSMELIRDTVVVQGRNLSGDKILVIWRDVDQMDNAALNAFFRKLDINTRDSEFKRIYVNGDNNLENLRTDDEQWKVVLIEEEFHRRMFEES